MKLNFNLNGFVLILAVGLVVLAFFLCPQRCTRKTPNVEIPKIINSDPVIDTINGKRIATLEGIITSKDSLLLVLDSLLVSNDEKAIQFRKENEILKRNLQEASERIKEKDGEIRNLIRVNSKLLFETRKPLGLTDSINATGDSLWQNEYTDSLAWVYIKSTINPKTREINYIAWARNDFTVVTYYRKGKLYAEVTNENPYALTLPGTNVFEFGIQTDRSRWGIGIQSGAGYTINGKISPYIGVGIQYNFLFLKKKLKIKPLLSD